MAGLKQKTGNTTEKHGTTQVSASLSYDYVTVVGASYMTLYEKYRDQKGNKMRFINQGIRQLTKYPPGTENFSTQRVFLIFKDDYEPKLLTALKDLVEQKHGAQYRELESVSGLVDFIYTRQRKGREIKQMDFFSHGVVGAIEFGWELDTRESYRLRAAQAHMFQPEAFAYGAKLTSYACRTGLGINTSERVFSFEDPHYERSFAQVLANATKTTVWAFPRRSNYDTTYGTKAERDSAEGLREKIKVEKDAKRAYQQQLNAYQKKLAAHRRAVKDKSAQLPSEQAPVKPVSTVTDEQRNLVAHMDSRASYQQSIGYPLDALGAHRDVRSGDTPEGVPKHLCEYKPA